jgi:MFS family permease
MLLDDTAPAYWTIFFGVIGTIVLIIGIVGCFLIREPVITTRDNQHFFKNLVYGFRPSVIGANKTLYLTLIAYAVFGISIQIFMPYLILYYTETLHMDNYVLIFAPAIVLAAVYTFFYGKFYDRKGFRAAIVAPIAMLMSGYVLLYLFRSFVPVFAGTLIMLCGYLSGMAVFGAMLRDHTPENKAGMFQGQRIIGQVLIPGVIGPYIGAYVLRNAEMITNSDGTQSFLPNANIFLAALIAALVLCVSLIPLVKKAKSR